MMGFQIIAFVLDVAASLLTAACLLRMYMQAQRISFTGPLGQMVFALTNWLVLPLRRLLPAAGRLDWVSLLAAFLVQLLQFSLLWLLAGAHAFMLALPWLALCGLLRVALWCAMGGVIIYAVLSWVQPHAPMFSLAQRLAEPLLRPLRRIVPLVGGVDLSALLLLVLLQVGLMVLEHLRMAGLGQLVGVV